MNFTDARVKPMYRRFRRRRRPIAWRRAALIALLSAGVILACHPGAGRVKRGPGGAHWSHSGDSPLVALPQETLQQDRRFAGAIAAAAHWIEAKAFPGAVLAVGRHGSLVLLKSFGTLDWSRRPEPTRADTLFDLASVSKVVGTTTAAALLYEQGKLSLDAPVVEGLPEFAGKPGHERVTIRHLLSHSSGLHAQRKFYQETQDPADLLRRVFSLDLLSVPGEKAVYRDYNLLVLGELIQRVSGQPLDQFLDTHLFAPLGMADTGYNPPRRLWGRVAPTEFDQVLRKRVVRGEVHDENCYLLGGVCGHAGLFSTATDLAVFAQMMLNRGHYAGVTILRPETVELFTRRQTHPEGTTRALGWDTPHPGSFAGELASPDAFMHTGFTGTSVYIDPRRDAFIILLTNRVHPTRANQKIVEARVDIHSAVLRALDQEGL